MRLSGVRRGSWTDDEDKLLKECVEKYGAGQWHLVPVRSGLNRCRKSCRLRWLNYLQPNLKRGAFGEDETDLLFKLHKLLGNRWSLIAGRLPGRTGNDVKNFWNTNLRKKLCQPRTNNNPNIESHEARNKSVVVGNPRPTIISTNNPKTTSGQEAGHKSVAVVKPRPKIFSKTSLASLHQELSSLMTPTHIADNAENNTSFREALTARSFDPIEEEAGPQSPWWERLLFEEVNGSEEDGLMNLGSDSFFDAQLWDLIENEK